MKSINTLITALLTLGLSFNPNLKSDTYNKVLTDSYFGCTPSNDRAKQTVTFFLQMAQFEEQRAKSGTQNILIDQITHVENNEVCSKLNELVNSNDKLKHEELNFTKYYYQVSEFYFIFYKFNSPRMGITKFIVIDKEYKVKGVFGV